MLLRGLTGVDELASVLSFSFENKETAGFTCFVERTGVVLTDRMIRVSCKLARGFTCFLGVLAILV